MISGNEKKFGAYVLKGSPRVLVRGKNVIDLPHRQLKLLSVLLAAKGMVVTREALMDAVWRDVFVEEHNLNQTVFLLRRSLGKLPDGGDYIETVPRRGYRMSAAAIEDQGVDVEVMPERRVANGWRSALQRTAPWLATVLRFPRRERRGKQTNAGPSVSPIRAVAPPPRWQTDRRVVSVPAKAILRSSLQG
ncbi:DNA-binding protein with winged-HTH domain [Terriglobus roseus DSM 18391]|uniref:DNA-binding protein with winged-HTH domain n=1 Tax=Terriglobus roseus (strain DSM 18391 / NRRL B-41598 / KBS 63) TaxID=926566 RepID=I3ZCY4_TERRK|nr:DNA-binding protein with winged-HTH domain [Terriglobus roseus DSM 18391]